MSTLVFSARGQFDWLIRARTLSLGRRTLVMGILNVTPDSFSDGGSYGSPKAAATRALQMQDEGADIIDVGGESTRPNALPLTAAEEQRRILPVVEAILKRRPDTVLSIDTYHSETARAAVEAGAEIVNDVSGHMWDARMASICADLGCGSVIMHTRGRPGEWSHQPTLAAEEVVPLVIEGLRQRIEGALNAGVATTRIVLDPGFGFGKVGEENYALLAGLSQLRSLGFPLMAGLSRKSFLRSHESMKRQQQRMANETQSSLLSATLAANTAAVLAGAHILRVHDVLETRSAADAADHILQAAVSGGTSARG